MSATKSQATFEQLLVTHNSEWCQVLWRNNEERHNGYRMIILSSYGSWSHYWYAGDDSFPRWLAGLNFEYMGRKLIDQKLFDEFDAEATLKSVKREIIASRRAGDLDKDTAFEYHEQLCDLERDGGFTSGRFETLVADWPIDDLWDCGRKAPCATWRNFWEYLWKPAVIPALKALS